MKSTFNKQSFEKGKSFEDYIQNNIFTKEHYDLLRRTSDHQQNVVRFPEDSKKPDFSFRCRKSNLEFYVEAKYRSRLNLNNEIEIFNNDQFSRFHEFDQKELLVLIAIGKGGQPDVPESVSLIPIQNINSDKIKESTLQKYIIKKEAYTKSSQLKQWNDQRQKNKSSHPSNSNNQVNKQIGISRKRLFITTALIAIPIFLFIFFRLRPKENKLSDKDGMEVSSNSKEKLKMLITDYYSVAESGNVEALDYYIAEQVDRWFILRNVNLKSIKSELTKYNNKYPHRKVKIDWKSFSYTELPNGDLNATYDIEYSLGRSNIEPKKRFMLTIRTIWNKELKLKSMYEEHKKN